MPRPLKELISIISLITAIYAISLGLEIDKGIWDYILLASGGVLIVLSVISARR